MKKIVFMLLLATSISLRGWAKESRIHVKKNTKVEEKLLTLKPTWDCWHFSIACINGWFCADNLFTAFDHAAAIANQYCPCPENEI